MSLIPILFANPQNKGGKGGGKGGGYPSTTGKPSGGGRTNGPRK